MAKTEQLDGAQALVRCLEREGVEYIWGLSGGAAASGGAWLCGTPTRPEGVALLAQPADRDDAG